jgi:hypothetical protein
MTEMAIAEMTGVLLLLAIQGEASPKSFDVLTTLYGVILQKCLKCTMLVLETRWSSARHNLFVAQNFIPCIRSCTT